MAGNKVETQDFASLREENMVVVYKETINNDGFVITAFMTSKPEKIFKKGVLWKK